MLMATWMAELGSCRSAAIPFSMAVDEDAMCAPSAPNAKRVLTVPTESTDDVLTLTPIDIDAFSDLRMSSLT